MPIYRKSSEVPVPADELFRWHERPAAFDRLMLPGTNYELVRDKGGIKEGGLKQIKLRKGPFWLTWEAHHYGYKEGREFRDYQFSGPFSGWEHTHRTVPLDGEMSRLEDEVNWRLPLHPIGYPLLGWAVKHRIESMFAFRHERTRRDVTRHHAYADREPLRVAVSGSTGLVGSALVNFLRAGGHDVERLVRHNERYADEISWNPKTGELDPKDLRGKQAVVHLAGEPLFGFRWDEEKKRRIRRSRVNGTRTLSETLARMQRPPKVMVCASAIGFYGQRGDEVLTEESAPGEGFLADVCEEWEEATAPAKEAGIRVVSLRIGIVLSPEGGALKQMLPVFKLGLGGRLGSGEQWMSWIALDDLVGIIYRALQDKELSGPYNATSPRPVTNREFAKTLGSVLNRPAVIPVPEKVITGVLGEMGEEMLGSVRVVPDRLESEHNFRFATPDLEDALRFELARMR